MIKSNIQQRLSFYSKVEIDQDLEVDLLDTQLPFYKVKQEKIYVVKGHNVGKPSLISYDIFGTTELGWLIMHVNDIMDPYEELYLGKELIVPQLKEYYNFYSNNRKKAEPLKDQTVK